MLCSACLYSIACPNIPFCLAISFLLEIQTHLYKRWVQPKVQTVESIVLCVLILTRFVSTKQRNTTIIGGVHFDSETSRRKKKKRKKTISKLLNEPYAWPQRHTVYPLCKYWKWAFFLGSFRFVSSRLVSFFAFINWTISPFFVKSLSIFMIAIY